MSKRNSTSRSNTKIGSKANIRSKQTFSIQNRKEKVEVLPEPIKSASDKKLYKTIKLQNGLTALLISDPSQPTPGGDETSSEEESYSEGSSDQDSEAGSIASEGSADQPMKKTDFNEEKLAACALCVGVGSYSDPPDIQGLAHFVEHMVFMGSTKYPKENDFDSFIKKKGGSDNASTDCEVTTFYLEIQEKYLLQAMDKFSQFFVSPLMKKEAMQREREAIESEFANASPSDSNRKEQILSSLFPAGHPARTFTWGNLKSLRDNLNGNDEKLNQAAHAFRQHHYSAHRMTLAVQARMNLTTLEQYVVNTFGQIPFNSQPADDFSPYKFTPTQITPEFNKIYYVKPISDTTELHLSWMMRPLISEYKSKPHQYISHLLGHEGAGSLLSYLKRKVWALGIYTGNSESGIDYTSMYSLFSTQVVLTKEGLQNVDKVLEAIFSYINMLKKLGPSERLYKEIKTIEETSFKFETESQPADYVETLAENMHFYPSEHYITGDKLYYKYDPEGITEALDSMTADAVNIMILSNKHSPPIEYDLKEKWFGTDYTQKDVPQDWLKSWLEVEPYDCFHLPAENIYITTNFDIIPTANAYLQVADQLGVDLKNASLKDLHKKVSNAEAERQLTMVLKEGDIEATVKNFRLDQPNLLRKNSHMEVWYRPDFKFRFPTALLYFYFITPLSLKSPRDSCLLDLWTDVLQQGLKESVYPASMADLQHSVYNSDKGITAKFTGYSQNLHLLVELVTQEMRSSSDNLTPGLFEAVREVRARSYHNVLIKPNKLAKDVRMNVLLEPYISPRQKVELINSITCEELKAFSKTFLDRLYMQVLMQGNIPWYDAIKISEKVQSNIKWEGLSAEEFPKISVHELPLGEKKVRVMSFNQASTNSIVANYYQAGNTNPRDTAVLEALMMLMEEPVFDRLRTKEQLGYSVFSMMRYTFGVLGFSVTVNSQVDKFSVAHVDSRIEAFLKKFARDMRRLPERTLQTTKQALTQLKHTTDVELREEVDRNWREVVSQEYKFQRLFMEADAIQRLKLSDLKVWVDDHFPSGNKKQLRKLSVQVIGHKPNESSEVVSSKDINTSPSKYQLILLGEDQQANGDVKETSADFVRDIDTFKGALKNFPPVQAEVPVC